MSPSHTLKKAAPAMLWVAVLAVALIPPAAADPIPVAVDWATCIILEEINLQAPRILASINPQPEPPGGAVLDLTNPANPILARETGGIAPFRVLFALGGPEPVIFVPYIIHPEIGSGHLEFEARHAATEQLMFQVVMDIFTSSGGFPVLQTWTQINPQPEPPLPVGAAYTGFDFTFSSLSTAYLSFQVQDSQGQALGFSQVPAPSSLLLLGSGLIPLLRRKKTRG